MAHQQLLEGFIEQLLNIFGPAEPIVTPKIKDLASNIEEKYVALIFDGIVCPCDYCQECGGEHCGDYGCAFDESHDCGCIKCTELVAYMTYMYRRFKFAHHLRELVDQA